MDPERDGMGFLVRFTCGALLGAVFGFGVWVQMCRPLRMPGGFFFWPYLTKALGLQERINSWQSRAVIVMIFMITVGFVAALWRRADLRWVRRLCLGLARNFEGEDENACLSGLWLSP